MTGVLQHPLPYVQKLEERHVKDISLVVIHCTELPDLATARQWGEKIIYPHSGTGNSGHFYIDRNGHTEEWVPLTRTAHHTRDFNSQSIGIELVNRGRYPDWFHTDHQQMTEVYSETQIHALKMLLKRLAESLPGLRNIAGHEDLDVTMQASEDKPGTMVKRKTDPGPLFPWAEIMENSDLVRMTANTP